MGGVDSTLPPPIKNKVKRDIEIDIFDLVKASVCKKKIFKNDNDSFFLKYYLHSKIQISFSFFLIFLMDTRPNFYSNPIKLVKNSWT